MVENEVVVISGLGVRLFVHGYTNRKDERGVWGLNFWTAYNDRVYSTGYWQTKSYYGGI